MARKVQRLEADVVIAGSGPGGCTIARELSRKGKKVIIMEKGGADTRLFGTLLGGVLKMERSKNFPFPAVRRTKEGENLILGTGVGGGTLIYAGAAFLPDVGYWKKYGINITQDLVDEAVKDCWVHLPPDEFIGPGTRRLWDAARELGFRWEKQYRFVDFNKCKIGCETCISGCPRGAKWTGRVFADEAVNHGATLLADTKVREAIIEGGAAVGVRARDKRGLRYEISAKVVVCSAGGVGTVPILKRAGLYEAGSWFAGDATVISTGFLREGKGNGYEHTMSVGVHDEEHGCVFATTLGPSGIWRMTRLQGSGLRGLRDWRRYSKALGVFCKISDEGVGNVPLEGRPSRVMTDRDRYRMDYGRVTNERILTKAGCDPYSIRHNRPTLGHPGLTVRVGKLLDSNLETPVKNLYCCDTSVLPEAPGMPPALTVVVLGKRLAKRLEVMV